MSFSHLLRSIAAYFGHGSHSGHGHSHSHSHSHGHGGHGHSHGTVDPSLASTLSTTSRGIWALKWSFVILCCTAIMQVVVFSISGSVALLADTVHNIGDAATAIPLWIAFLLARRAASARFPYGLGRAEDIAGLFIVFAISASTIIAGYEATQRLLHPQPVQHVQWVILAGIVGFIGNEAVAYLRIRVGHEINSAALIADGYHARTDGLTSLAVVAGSIGIWFGFPWADPAIALIITISLASIAWQSARSVFTRMLDGIDPELITEATHALQHTPGISGVGQVQARWLGHRLAVDAQLFAPSNTTVEESNTIAAAAEAELREHLPSVGQVHIRISPTVAGAAPAAAHHHHGHHAPDPVAVSTSIASGTLSIVDTPAGERMQFVASSSVPGLQASVTILRPTHHEQLPLSTADHTHFISSIAPAEPHEFTAELHLQHGDVAAAFPFSMSEPTGHHH